MLIKVEPKGGLFVGVGSSRFARLQGARLTRPRRSKLLAESSYCRGLNNSRISL